MITLADRASNYHKVFPNWPAPRTDGRWLDAVWPIKDDDCPTPDVDENDDLLNGVWVLGQNYQGSGYYGAYPPNYVARVRALFPEIVDGQSKILHLFSGMLAKGPHVRLDLQNAPDVKGNAEQMPFKGEMFDFDHG